MQIFQGLQNKYTSAALDGGEDLAKNPEVLFGTLSVTEILYVGGFGAVLPNK